jgi:DNA-binding CsgD family transcriptional regulator
MDQLWLGISLFGFFSGAVLFGALLLLSRLSELKTIPVLLVCSAFLVMGISSLTGVYLRVLGIPSSVPAYRLLNSLAWAYALYAVLTFLSNHRKRGSAGRGGLRYSPGTALPAGLVFVLLVLSGPLSEEYPPADGFPLAGILMIAFIAALSYLCIRAGGLALSEAQRTASLPWRRLLRGMGVALIVLPAAELADFSAMMILSARGIEWYDGFIFSCGYAIANLALIAGIVSSFSAERMTGRSGTPGGASAVPSAFSAMYALTRRETEIVEKLLLGKSDREIAAELYISPRTVDTHLRNVFRKCEVSTRMQLARLVGDYGNFRN